MCSGSARKKCLVAFSWLEHIFIYNTFCSLSASSPRYSRLVLIAGLTVCSLIVLIFMVTYFAGSAASVNTFLFRVYEYFFNETLEDTEKVELKHELRYYGASFFVLAATFFIYK